MGRYRYYSKDGKYHIDQEKSNWPLGKYWQTYQIFESAAGLNNTVQQLLLRGYICMKIN